MNFLKIENKKSLFIISDKEIEPENLDKDDLLEILSTVFENHKDTKFPSSEALDTIINPIEKEIVEHIVYKIKELHSNIPHIKQEINNRFPQLE